MPSVDGREANRRQERAARPNVWPWPPIILCACAVIAIAAEHLFPTSAIWPASPTLRIAGAVAMLAGLGFDVTAMTTMWRHNANILPHRAATALVTTGPFALSRNPIYLGNTLLLAGAGFAFANAWLLLAALASAWLVSLLAIRREEAHLAIRFGDAWQIYAQRTPRWLRLW